MIEKHITWVRVAWVAFGLGVALAIIQPDCYLTYGDRELTWPAIWPRTCFYVPVCLVVLSLLLFPLKIIRWLFAWRTIKWLLLGLAVIFVPVALFYAREDWRGKNAWDKYRQAEEAKGEKFDFASFIPPPVPDEQNFALAPIVASCYSRYLDENGHRLQPENTNVVNRLDMKIGGIQDQWLGNTNTLGSWQLSEVVNLPGWQYYYRTAGSTNYCTAGTNEFPLAPTPQSPGADVVLALSKYNSALEDLHQAANQHEKSRFPINYDSASPTALVQPHLYYFEDCGEVLELRAVAELADHQSGKALADIKLVMRLSDSIQNEPGFYSQLIRLALLRDIFQPIWEGATAHKWSDSQLADLEQEMGRLNLLTEYPFAMRSERAQNIATIEFMRRHRTSAWNCIPMITYLGRPDTYESPEPPEVQQPQNFALQLIPWLLPNGWFYSSEMTIGRIYQPSLPAAGDDERAVISAAQSAESVKENESQHRCRWNLVALTVCPYFGRLAKFFIEEQASLNLARTACALERYSLAHGNYPENLNLLAPQFIEFVPHDIITGKSLHYRRTSDGRFQLYSIGWSGKDNGAIPGQYSEGEFDFRKGDLVWQYPAANGH